MENQSDYVRMTLRLPPELHELLVKSAKMSQNSTNTEVIKRLSSSLASDIDLDSLSGHELKRFLAIISEEIRDCANNISKVASQIE